MQVEKLSAWIPVSDVDIVDFRIGTPEQQATAARRLDAERARSEAAWRALPVHVRLVRTLRYQRWRIEERVLDSLHRWLFPGHDR